MAGRKSDFVLPTLDDLFSTQEMRDEQKLARTRDIPIELIDNFPDHPFKVRDDEATILMVESNFQRSQILPSEKAFAYKMRLEAMKRQVGRPNPP